MADPGKYGIHFRPLVLLLSEIKNEPLLPIPCRAATLDPVDVNKSPLVVKGINALKAAVAVVWPVPPFPILSVPAVKAPVPLPTTAPVKVVAPVPPPPTANAV